MPAEEYGNADFADAAIKIVDNMQNFIMQDGNLDEAMSNVLDLFNGRGKLRERMTKAFRDKAVLARAFGTFLFEASPELKEITERLNVQTESLRDKIFGVMQDAIYTWTETQVKEKLTGVVSEYRYLDALNTAMRSTYHSSEEAVKDLKNAFSYMRVAIFAIEQLNKPWYKALAILRKASRSGIAHMTVEERNADIEELKANGTLAWECVKDAKPVLSDILESMQQECTPQELDSIYAGLRDVSCDATVNQFEKDLNTQLSRISHARNRSILLEHWKTISSTETVKKWSNDYGVPLLWVVPKAVVPAIRTLISVQNNERTLDQNVQAAICALDNLDASILTNRAKIEAAFLSAIGDDYREIFDEERTQILSELKLALGNDISSWAVTDLARVQQTLKRRQIEKAKREKLQNTKERVNKMQEKLLRDKVTSFLEKNPQFCDFFN